MFTGLIETIGTIKGISRRGGGLRLAVDVGPDLAADARIGDSVSVNGACLTVAAKAGNVLHFDVVPESAEHTNLGLLTSGGKVNLERPLSLGDRLGGHIVQGHVDGIGTVERIDERGDSIEMEISASPEMLRYVVVKGSVAVDGVSLTVAGVGERSFRVALIPTTLKETTLGPRKSGDKVNIETDVLAKYVEKLSGAGSSGEAGVESGVTEELLERSGFI